ncbi:MAG: hypothetical protein E7035_08995 [Verrucomicrobiaceae bacterium]|nr:hypothetical protein [Verrucomicrobiaceae bacterium]
MRNQNFQTLFIDINYYRFTHQYLLYNLIFKLILYTWIFFRRNYAQFMQIKIEEFKTFIYEETPPDVSFLPMLVRRKLDMTGKIVISLAHALTQGKTNYKSVYASRYGYLNEVINLFEGLNSGAGVSPNGFSSSVHNFPIGMQSIIAKNKASYTAIAGCKDSLELGLLEAFCLNEDVLYIYVQGSLNEVIQADEPPQIASGLGLFATPSKTGINVEFGNFSNTSIQFEQISQFLEKGGELCGKFLKLTI